VADPDAPLVVQVALGLVFLASGLAKMWHPLAFARGVVAYRVIFERPARVVGLLVPPTEMLLAGAHLTGFALMPLAACGLVMLACFVLAVGTVLWRGSATECQCFGNDGQAISSVTITRILVLAIGELLVLATFDPTNAHYLIDPTVAGSERTLVFMTAILVLICGSWLTRIHEVLQLARKCNTCGTRLGAER
jgi:hypothetical protein